MDAINMDPMDVLDVYLIMHWLLMVGVPLITALSHKMVNAWFAITITELKMANVLNLLLIDAPTAPMDILLARMENAIEVLLDAQTIALMEDVPNVWNHSC